MSDPVTYTPAPASPEVSSGRTVTVIMRNSVGGEDSLYYKLGESKVPEHVVTLVTAAAELSQAYDVSIHVEF